MCRVKDIDWEWYTDAMMRKPPHTELESVVVDVDVVVAVVVVVVVVVVVAMALRGWFQVLAVDADAIVVDMVRGTLQTNNPTNLGDSRRFCGSPPLLRATVGLNASTSNEHEECKHFRLRAIAGA